MACKVPGLLDGGRSPVLCEGVTQQKCVQADREPHKNFNNFANYNSICALSIN